ncbi:hypothetical protein BIU87_20840 [Streptomyces sp. ZS0098]|uniref:hypothetical protein n=1 Tax=unclassified Streptomyces TaxID=2593676 RepID=UPI000EFA9941|nr:MULTISPECIES: hypothetical protein [unclassified Streptomyces]MBJ6633374.1 hypothetical protein [Streptomyces sp. I5]RMI92051.1 hypothetical protein BIU87_20840 [Streptomyces sp. ZS0098]
MAIVPAGARLTADRFNAEVPGPWRNVTFANWQQGGLTYAPLRVQKYGNRARLDGHAQPSASYSGNQLAFTIPSDLAPLYQHYFNAIRITSGTPTQVGLIVSSTGAVTVYSSTTIGTTDRYDFSFIDWPLD